MSSAGLVAAIVDALRGPAATPEAGDMAVFFAISSIMAGNWQPLEQVRVPVKTFLEASGRVGTVEDRQTSVNAIVNDDVVQPLSHDDGINLFLAEHAKAGTDAMGAVRAVVSKYLLTVVNGFLDYAGTPELPFSRALQGTMIGFAGEWFTSVGACLDTPDAADMLAVKVLELSKTEGIKAYPDRAPKLEMMFGCGVQLYQSLKAQALSQQTQ